MATVSTVLSGKADSVGIMGLTCRKLRRVAEQRGFVGFDRERERVVVESERAHPPRRLRLDQEVGAARELEKTRAVRVLLQVEHDPANIDRAREIASSDDPIPVGILYRNPEVPCYEDLRRAGMLRTTGSIRSTLESEFDKFTVWP